AGSEELVAPVHKLLEDLRPAVRLRASLALAQFHDPRAVTTLIACLAEVPTALGKPAEDFLVNLAGDQAPKEMLGEDQKARERSRDGWAAWWKKTADPGLMDEFRKRTLKDEDRQKVLDMIKKLGDDDYVVREKAETDLVALGVAAVPLLNQGGEQADPEISNRIKKCLETIGKDKTAPASPVTARLVALHKPEGAAEALLGYLPFAEDENLTAEVRMALMAVAFRDGKLEPAVLNGLKDKYAVRRAAAAEAICQPGGAKYYAEVKELLHDQEPMVKVRAALALAAAREKDSIPVLID